MEVFVVLLAKDQYFPNTITFSIFDNKGYQVRQKSICKIKGL